MYTHPTRTVEITANGYLYIYCSNESNIPVYFDNLQVVHNHGPLMEETHYYPFGLTMAGISSKAAGEMETKYKFNKGNELQHKEFSDGSGLELYDAHYRMQDPQLGRFWQIDALAGATTDISSYVFGSDNPISRNDPFGLYDNNMSKDEKLKKKPKDKPGFNGTTANLPEVSVTTKTKRSQGGDWLGMPPITQKQMDNNRLAQNIYWQRKATGQDVNRKGDPASYSSHVDLYNQWGVADKEYRQMSIGAVIAIASPILLAGTPELTIGNAFNMSWQTRLGLMGGDATLQLIEKGSINPIQVVGANFGPLTYALTGATTFSYTNFSVGIDENASAQSVLVSTVVNIGAGNVSDAFSPEGSSGSVQVASGFLGAIPTLWGDAVNSFINGTSGDFMQYH